MQCQTRVAGSRQQRAEHLFTERAPVLLAQNGAGFPFLWRVDPRLTLPVRQRQYVRSGVRLPRFEILNPNPARPIAAGVHDALGIPVAHVELGLVDKRLECDQRLADALARKCCGHGWNLDRLGLRQAFAGGDREQQQENRPNQETIREGRMVNGAERHRTTPSPPLLHRRRRLDLGAEAIDR